MANKKLHIAYAPLYAHSLPEGHRFPMLKYELIPGQLLYEGVVTEDAFFTPTAPDERTILKTHTAAYLHQLTRGLLTAQEQRHIGFPQSEALIQRELVITGGTIACCHHALENGVALNVAGGTHHAFADRGEGFCLLNDFAVAANYMLHHQLASRILIIDLDVHQGNGTAKIFEKEERVFTFSMHGRNNYPFRKEKSDWDLELEDGTDDATYLQLLQQALPQMLQRVQPQMVFYLSGVDVLATDKFGKLKVSMDGCRQRDEMVFAALQKRGLPCVVAMGGGYSPDVKTIVTAHCHTFKAAKDIYGL